MAIKKAIARPKKVDNDLYVIRNNEISIDVSVLYNVSNNDESFIKLMVETFLKTMPDTIKRLRQSIEEQDWENVYRTAHFAKSSLSVIKVNEVFDDVLAVAVNSKNRTNLQDIQPLFEKIEEKYSSAEALLKEKFAAKVE